MEELGKRWIENDCRVLQVNSCEDRDITLLLLAILFVYNIAIMERVVCLPSYPFPAIKRVSKPLRVHESLRGCSSVCHGCVGVLCADSAVPFRVLLTFSIPFHSVPFRVLLTTTKCQQPVSRLGKVLCEWTEP